MTHLLKGLLRWLLILGFAGLVLLVAAGGVAYWLVAPRLPSVDVLKDGQVISARSIMGLMMLGAAKGADIELRAEGWDAKEALDALAALVEAGFNEQD